MTRGVPGHWFTDILTELIRDIVQPRCGLVQEYTDGVFSSGGILVRRLHELHQRRQKPPYNGEGISLTQRLIKPGPWKGR